MRISGRNQRQEHDPRAPPANDRVGQQIAQQRGGQFAAHQILQGRGGAIQPVLKRLGPGKHGLEHHEQQGKEHRRPQPGVQQHPVHARMDAMARGFGKRGALRHLPRQQAAFGQRHMHARRRGFIASGGVARHGDGRGQLGQPLAPHRHGFDHRHAQFGGQRGGIDRQPVARSQIDHVERDYGGPAQFQHFLGKDQMLFEVGGIEHDDQHIGPHLAHLLAHDDLAGHFLVRAGGGKAIGTGQIDQFDRLATGQQQAPGLALHRDAWIVGDLLARAGQRIEQRGFSGIGIAHQRGDKWPPAHAANSSTCIARAWMRRSATVIRPISIARGSRPRNTPR